MHDRKPTWHSNRTPVTVTQLVGLLQVNKSYTHTLRSHPVYAWRNKGGNSVAMTIVNVHSCRCCLAWLCERPPCFPESEWAGWRHRWVDGRCACVCVWLCACVCVVVCVCVCAFGGWEGGTVQVVESWSTLQKWMPDDPKEFHMW